MNRKAQLAFIAQIAPLAQQSHKRFGVPASVVIAQAILESGWGQSVLSRYAQNFFGIKSPQDAGQYVEFQTKEFENGQPVQEIAKFRRFDTQQSCFDVHALLLTRKRYEPAMADADDPLVFASRLQDCGYSTDPEYAKKLVALITGFKLRKYDLAKSEAGRPG